MSDTQKTIFKYEPFSTRSLLNLKQQSVYFASPKQFNDPYDCAITPQIKKLTSEEIELMRKHYLDKESIPESIKRQLESLAANNLSELLEKTILEQLEAELEKRINTIGICCFSEINYDLLMWSHYGGQYKGICLEFRTDCAPFNGKLRKVNYVERIPLINIVSTLPNKDGQFITDLFCTKSKAWEYEREWRAIHNERGTLFTYVPEALKSVYFGPEMEEAAIETVCLVLQGQNPDVTFWQGTRSTSEFKVEFKSFSYTSFIDAKKQGLR